MGTTVGMVLFADEDVRLRVLPWVWIVFTAGLTVDYGFLPAGSPDRAAARQLVLLVAAVTFLWTTVLLPPRHWFQNVLGAPAAAALVALVAVRRASRGASGDGLG